MHSRTEWHFVLKRTIRTEHHNLEEVDKEWNLGRHESSKQQAGCQLSSARLTKQKFCKTMIMHLLTFRGPGVTT